MPSRQTRRRAREILAELADIDFALPGSIVRRTTRCGRPSCQCQADPPVLHGPYLSWIRKTDGKPITRNLTPEQEQRYRPWFDNSRRLQQLITELQALSVQAIEDAEGWHNQRRPPR
ncbi:MAG TPA: DUF6788 family protein [Streptomyces sp.]|jgi:hypothetical protein|nr:DUF6788 family protein [Nocardioidaceae bacterium]HWU22874.1 DUF6788 family protein [Nocardioides sp.]